MKYLKLVIYAVVLAMIAGPAYALDAERYVLDTGMVLLHKQSSTLPMVSVKMIINTGDIDVPARSAGLAGMTAAMLRQGTTTLDALEFSEQVQYIGATIGSSASLHVTSIAMTVLSRDLDRGFELMADMLLRPAFAEQELTRLKEQTKGAILSREDNPSFVASREFRAAMFGNTHPYGRQRSGTVQTVDDIRHSDITEFYSKYYHPDNAIMAVAGDISKKELLELIRKHLGKWEPKGLRLKQAVPAVKPHGQKTVLIDRDITQANIVFGHKSIHRSHPDYYVFSVMNYILGGGGFSSRLMQSVRDEMGLAYGIYSSLAPYVYSGHFLVSVRTKNSNALDVIAEIKRQIKNIQDNPVSKEELADAKSFLTGSFPRRLETLDRISSYMSQTEYNGLGLDYDLNFPQYINSITRQDVQRVARELLDTENHVLVVVAKQSETGINNGVSDEMPHKQ